MSWLASLAHAKFLSKSVGILEIQRIIYVFNYKFSDQMFQISLPLFLDMNNKIYLVVYFYCDEELLPFISPKWSVCLFLTCCLLKLMQSRQHSPGLSIARLFLLQDATFTILFGKHNELFISSPLNVKWVQTDSIFFPSSLQQKSKI